ncbi:uncharacterized protein LOC133190676 [Saccostrea echinata]|uniref:uncharacterized protein LOC133190676 n=1 Tax=Saccostrea echinata TaxID=191078 RepID=UPI002A7EACCC|nr:uncharacterized protein LOC133190676 [Saccostrea echinata]
MIYETDTTLVTSGSGECVTVEYTGDVFLTGFSKTVRIFENPSDEDCTKAHGVICKLEGAVIINLSRIFYNDPRKTWSDAVSRCYQQSAYQISTDLDSLTQNNSALSNSENAWLGIFRRHYNFTINTKPDILSTESNIHCIAASVDITGNIQLSNHKCNKSLPVWCMLQANVTLSSSTTPITTSRTTDVSTTPENMVTNSVKAVSSSVEITQDISLLITTTVLATIVGIGILTAIIILLRKIFKSRKTQSNVSIRHAIPNHKRKIQKNKSKSHYEESLNAVYEEDIYSVIIDNNEEIPRYSEVIYDDVENNDTKNISSQKYVNTLPSLGRTESSTNSQLKEIPEYLEIIPYEPQNISEKTGVESNCQETGDFCKLNNENGAANEESSMFSDAKEAVDGKTTV